MSINIILAGGGNARQSRTVDAFYRERLGDSATVAYIPHAVTLPGYWDLEKATNWLTDRDAMTGVEVVVINDLSNVLKQAPTATSHFLMGGNTFTMVDAFRRHGYDKVLSRLIVEGILVYGISAGAIYMGQSITSASLGTEPDDNDVGLLDMRGLNFLRGMEVFTHYTTEQKQICLDFAHDSGCNVIALSEEGGAFFDGDSFLNIGADDFYVVSPVGAIGVFTPGETFAPEF